MLFCGLRCDPAFDKGLDDLAIRYDHDVARDRTIGMNLDVIALGRADKARPQHRTRSARPKSLRSSVSA